MPLPKSVTKIDMNGVTFISDVDRCNYTIKELTRAALRDVGKFVCRTFRQSYYAKFRRTTWRVGRSTQYWVRSKQAVPDLQVGLKANGFYGAFQELGTDHQPQMGLLSKAVEDNIATIVEIESKYLSALEDEAAALAMISEEEYEGGADD